MNSQLNNIALDKQIITPWLGTDEPLNILVILSFSPLFPWSQEVQKGLVSAVNAQDKPINLYIESMYESPAHFNSARYHFDLSLRTKYANIEFDGVIADARSAFEYLQALPENDPFFTADLPIYFTFFTFDESNNYAKDKSILNTHLNAINTTLTHLFSVRPNAKNLHIIGNNPYMVNPYNQVIKQYIDEHNIHISIKYYEHNDVSSYINSVAKIPPSDVIIYMPTFISNAKVNLNAVEMLKTLSPSARAPIYSFWHNFIGHGAIGGYLMNTHLYGVDAINNIVAYKENGAFIDSVAIGEWIFDYEQLNKFDIAIPESINGLKLINMPSTIWEDYPLETALIIFAGSLVLLLLFWYKQFLLVNALKRSQQAEQIAATNAERIEALSKTKSKFMATMSHEIRTPINGIFGALGLLAKQHPTPTQQKYLEIAQYCSDNLLNTVNDVLDFSKLDSDQFECNPYPFSPHHLMRQVQQYATLISKDTDLKIVLDIHQLVDVPLLGDELRLQQILNNLINNSVKFTPTGSITITANIIASFVPNHYQFKVAVKDTGIGIAEADLDKLFTPFIQINDTLERTKEGSGLGLSICKELIKLMDGDISVTSTIGLGSCFSFYVVLPQAMDANISSSADDSVNDSLDSSVDGVDFEHSVNDGFVHASRFNEHDNKVSKLAVTDRVYRILLVEDNEINQEVMKAQLTLLGHKVVIAENGQVAIDRLLSDSSIFDVILMDIQMPVLNGYDTTVAIRSGKTGNRYIKVPIIALSAHANLHQQPEYDLALFSAYLVKPAKEELLKQTLIDVI